MTKPEALKLMRLVSAMESWMMAQGKMVPDYLLEDTESAIQILEREILGPDVGGCEMNENKITAIDLAEYLTEYSVIKEGPFSQIIGQKAAAMLRKQHEAIVKLREALIDCKYGLEGARIWGGMEWTYNPLHAYKYLPLRDRAENALKDTEEIAK